MSDRADLTQCQRTLLRCQKLCSNSSGFLPAASSLSHQQDHCPSFQCITEPPDPSKDRFQPFIRNLNLSNCQELLIISQDKCHRSQESLQHSLSSFLISYQCLPRSDSQPRAYVPFLLLPLSLSRV